MTQPTPQQIQVQTARPVTATGGFVSSMRSVALSLLVDRALSA